MRKQSIFLSIFILLALLLTACGGEETSTTVPSTNVPPITAEVTSTESVTETPAGTDVTTTPAVPVTGENNPSRASNLMDFTVADQTGQQIGDVQDLVLDLDNVNVAYVVVATGDKEIPIPRDQLQMPGTGDNALVFTGDAASLSNFPDVDLNTALPETGQPAADWDADIRSFWESGGAVTGTAVAETPSDTTPTVEATLEATAMPEASATATTTTGTGGTAGQGQGASHFDKLQGVVLASDVIGATVMISPQGNGQGNSQGQGAATATPGTTGSGTEATATPGGAELATAITGPSAEATATTTTGNSGTNGSALTEATVSDLILDPASGDLQFLVISGSFSEGERWIPVPIGFLRWDVTNQAFVLMISGNALENAPSFTEDQFPDTSSSGWDTEFNDFWQNQGTGSGAGIGTVTAATATPTP